MFGTNGLLRNVDLDCLTTVLAKLAVNKAFHTPMKDWASPKGPLALVQDQLFTMLCRYRTFCASQAPRSQLILYCIQVSDRHCNDASRPEAIKHLPLYVMALTKHPSIREKGLSLETGLIDIQHRVFELHLLLSKGVRATINALYPRVFRCYPLHPEELENLKSSPPCSQFIESDNAYLIDDGTSFWIYVGRFVDPERLDEWFVGDDRKYITFNTESRDGSRIATLVEILRAASVNKQGNHGKLMKIHTSTFIS